MPMAIPDGCTLMVKPVNVAKAPASLKERCKELSDTCLLNAEALDKDYTVEQRKEKLDLSRAWYTYVESQGIYAIQVKIGNTPVYFTANMNEYKNSMGFQSRKDAAEFYRALSKALLAGDLNAEVEDAAKRASEVAKGRMTKKKKAELAKIEAAKKAKEEADTKARLIAEAQAKLEASQPIDEPAPVAEATESEPEAEQETATVTKATESVAEPEASPVNVPVELSADPNDISVPAFLKRGQ